jgi:phenylpropionate dioxygenase-like ring-hydroxylating dioxygenase large terminal subunit
MIRNQWYVILYSEQVKTRRPTGVQRLGEKLVLWRDSQTGLVHCLADRCTHRGASLSHGWLENGCVRCPFHGLQFAGDGRCVRIPANGAFAEVPNRYANRTYPVREAHGLIWLFWGDRQENLPPLPFFENLDDTRLTFGRCIDPWRCHYSRCIENQLDVVHLPFVHKTTIGRGQATVVNGPQIRQLEQPGGREMRIYARNEKDRGQIPLRDEDLPEPPPDRQHLAFRFPNLWQNYITDNMRIFIAFVPVDDDNTLLYMMPAHKFTRLPLLRQMLAGLLVWSSLVIAHQDRRVVEKQQPNRTSLRMNEKLVAGDKPVLLYRENREKLLQAVASDQSHPL